MTCNETAEFVSALCDGERIPREAAEHIGICPECRARLNEYVQMGLELKRIANVAEPDSVPKISWDTQQRTGVSRFQLWRGTMRIPRFAFALMLVVIAMLSTGLVLVKAREKTKPWFVFQMKNPNDHYEGATYYDPLTQLSKPDGIESVQNFGPDGMMAYTIRVLDSKEGALKIGIRTQKLPPHPDDLSAQERTSALAQARNAPEKVDWYLPGQKVRIPVVGFESYEFTGLLLDKVPDIFDPALKQYLPKEGTLRLYSPVLLRENKLVGNLNGIKAEGTYYKDGGAYFYFPGEGAFLLSLNDFAGAIEGKRSGSEVEFTINGHSYLLLTGAPLASDEEGKIWVANYPNYNPKGSHGTAGVSSVSDLLSSLRQ
jgi:hypothetical protein